MRNHAFDVVVVGAGAAGCVVAARLAESRSRSVLLLEAGPDLRASTPAVLRDGWNITGDFDWGLESEPDGRGVVDSVRRCRLVGGTSWRTRFALRGSPADFEEWVALGNPGWGFDDVLPYFKRLEADVDFPDQPWHGDAGPIPVDRYRDIPSTEVNEAAVAAMVEAGLPPVEDHNRPGAVGVGRIPMSGHAGARVTVADAYLPIDDAPANLTVLSDVHASHVVFEGTRARGVQLADGRIIDAGWVVVAAGTFGSPSVLMRSGIGPAAHLQSVGVATLVDLPGVGANLADHPGFGFDCGYTGTGRAAPILHSIGTFHSSRAATSEPPDLMFWVADPQEDEEGRAGFDLDVVLLKPRSRGAVRLRSADPTDPPRVDLPKLREQADVDTLVEGYLAAIDVVNRPALRGLCEPRLSATRDPAELRHLIREGSSPIPHFVGTCAMGASSDRGAVVDRWGSVHGTECLSVIDASIMPTVPSGFTHLPTIMIAERLSERVGSEQ